MENNSLKKPELQDLVEGWGPRIMDGGQDVMSNLGAASGGAFYAKFGYGATLALGIPLQIGNALAGPRHPWVQMLTRPGVGVVDAAIAIKVHESMRTDKAP